MNASAVLHTGSQKAMLYLGWAFVINQITHHFHPPLLSQWKKTKESLSILLRTREFKMFTGWLTCDHCRTNLLSLSQGLRTT